MKQREQDKKNGILAKQLLPRKKKSKGANKTHNQSFIENLADIMSSSS